ncbi:MAG TPA: flagellar motor switch protein FliN [Solirubrobacteraceae bacterium]|nr:flagellar motor switch protein FliN [Solirubrobacteraceae bacterium]
MSESVEYEQLEEAAQEPVATVEPSASLDASRLGEIPIGLSVEIGRASMTVSEALALRVGAVVALDRLAGEAVDLLANGSPIARGEVAVLEDRFALQITELVDAQA